MCIVTLIRYPDNVEDLLQWIIEKKKNNHTHNQEKRIQETHQVILNCGFSFHPEKNPLLSEENFEILLRRKILSAQSAK